MLSQEEKESLLHQRGVVFWLTGLSGAGKSSIAVAAARMLHEQGLLTKLLDGDNVRRRINANLGFTLADRQENIRRVAEIARLFRETGVVTLCAFISPTHKMRALAREIIGPDHFREVYLCTDLATCEARDPKGLYKKARAGQIPDFTGVHTPYEVPQAPDLRISTLAQTVAESAILLKDFILQEISIPKPDQL